MHRILVADCLVCHRRQEDGEPVCPSNPQYVLMLECICTTSVVLHAFRARDERINKSMAEGVAMFRLSLHRSMQHATLERVTKRARSHASPNVQIYTSARTLS